FHKLNTNVTNFTQLHRVQHKVNEIQVFTDSKRVDRTEVKHRAETRISHQNLLYIAVSYPYPSG
ncbi:TPA: hypothetical protein ACHCGC_004578, partial [Vibrio parahaemolyticus]